MRGTIAKQMRREPMTPTQYRKAKKAWKLRNVNDSPKNPPILFKKRHAGESMEDFKARRKRANLRKRKKRKKVLCLQN